MPLFSNGSHFCLICLFWLISCSISWLVTELFTAWYFSFFIWYFCLYFFPIPFWAASFWPFNEKVSFVSICVKICNFGLSFNKYALLFPLVPVILFHLLAIKYSSLFLRDYLQTQFRVLNVIPIFILEKNCIAHSLIDTAGHSSIRRQE